MLVFQSKKTVPEQRQGRLKAGRELKAKSERSEATSTEIARRIQMPVERVQDRLRLLGLQTHSLDEPFIRGDDDAPSVGEMTRDTRVLTSLEALEAKEELYRTYERLEKLMERARQLVGGAREFIFRLRCGLDGTLQSKYLRSIGKRFRLSYERIRHIEELVLEKLGIRKEYVAEERERILMLEDLVGDEAFVLRKRLAVPPFNFRSRLPSGSRKRCTS